MIYLSKFIQSNIMICVLCIAKSIIFLRNNIDKNEQDFCRIWELKELFEIKK